MISKQIKHGLPVVVLTNERYVLDSFRRDVFLLWRKTLLITFVLLFRLSPYFQNHMIFHELRDKMY